MRVHIRNETSTKLLTGKNAFVQFINPSYSINYTTNTGNNTVNLIPGDYTVRYRATGFPEKFYYFTLDNSTPNIMNLYLLNSTTPTYPSSEVTATVYDEIGTTVEDVYIHTLKYDSLTNSYLDVGTAKTNNDGITKMYLTLNSEFYQFALYYPYGQLNTITSPSYVYSTSINFRIQLREDPIQDFKDILSIKTNLTFNNVTNNFRWTYSDLNNISTTYCLNVYKSTSFISYLYNSTCVQSHVSTILVGITPSNGSTFTGKGYISQNDKQTEIDSATVEFKTYSNFSSTLENKMMGLFVIFVLTIVMILITRDIIISMFLSGIPFILGIYVGMLPGFSYQDVLYYYVVVVIVSFIISRFR